MKHLTIDNTTVLHDNWLGFGGVYHAYMYQPDDAGRAYTEAQCKKELDRIGALRLRVARTYFRWDWTPVGSGDPADPRTYDWNSPQVEALCRWLTEMDRRGVDVALQACWWIPLDLDRDDSPFAAGGADWAEKCRRYGVWVSEAVRRIVVERGHRNMRWLVLFTEPNGAYSIPEEQRMAKWETWRSASEAAHRQLAADGLRGDILLLGPNEGSTDFSPMVAWAADVAGGWLDVYSSHNYVQNLRFDFDTYDDWSTWMSRGLAHCAGTGKPYWFDEYGLANWRAETEIAPQRIRWTEGLFATHMALANCAALNLGVQSTTIWSLFDQQWPNSHNSKGDSFVDGEHRCGIAPTLRQSELPYPGYYGTALVSRHMGGRGTVTYAVRDDGHLRCACVRDERGETALLVVNATPEPVEFKAAFAAAPGALHRFLFDPAAVTPEPDAAPIPADRVFGGGSVADTLPAWGVAVYSTAKD